jgi:branched-chain amino acid transport system permease protein
MSTFIQQLINGLSIGGVYALMAVGYSLVYSIMNFSNFAHGGVIMIGAYIGFFAIAVFRLPFSVAMAAATFGAALLAIIIERIAYNPLRKRNAPYLYFIISAMGTSIFLENLVIATIGPNFKTYPKVFEQAPFTFGGLAIGRLDIVMFIISSVSLLLLLVIIEKTKTGMAIKATAYNLRASALMGVNTDHIIFIVFGLGGALAGVAGILFGMKYTVYPQIGFITTKAFIAAVIGGLGSLSGAVVGALFLGVLETLTAGYISSQLRDLIAFALLIFMLVVRPTGIMGKHNEDKA